MRNAWLCAGLVCALAGAALAQDPPASDAGRRGPPPHPRGPGGPHTPPLQFVFERYADRLGLDPSTAAAIRAIADASRERGRTRRDELRALHEELRALLSEASPDEEAVMQQAERIGAVETAAQQERLRDMLRVRALLTVEQRQELVRIHQERRSERGARPLHGPPHAPRDDAPPAEP
jgi:Spy/CpxP family protein refolding chaperone